MTRFYTLTLSTLCAVSLGMCIAGCGNQPVAHTNMTPNEIAATAFAATCQGAPLADLAFAAVGVFNPTIIDADARTWEASAYAGLQKRCNGPAPTVENYKQVTTEIAADIKTIMDVVAAAKNNPPAS
jgi:hypothetical protein